MGHILQYIFTIGPKYLSNTPSLGYTTSGSIWWVAVEEFRNESQPCTLKVFAEGREKSHGSFSRCVRVVRGLDVC